MSGLSKECMHEATGTTRQGLAQHYKRQDERLLKLDEAEVALVYHRKEHPGCGLVKLWQMINPNVGRDRFVFEMTRRGFALPSVRSMVRTTRSGSRRFPNLIKGLIISDQDQVWQSDTTYFRIGEQFCYITFIIDVYTRLTVGFSVSHSLGAEANVKALKMAIRARKGKDLTELILHSDGGTQYRYKPFVEELRNHGISSSMCEAATDNAYAERLNGVIKNEYLAYWSAEGVKELDRLTRKAVKNYNEVRPHGQLPNGVSPAVYERLLRDGKGGEPRLQLIRDGQADHIEWTPPKGLTMTGSGMWAPRDTAQIMPANVTLHQLMVNPQMVLEF